MDTNCKSKFIKINTITDLTELVRQASAVYGDVEIHKGRWCVDASSLMGVMSIDLSKGATIIYPVDADEFEAYISQFEA